MSQFNEQEKKAVNNFFEEFDDVFAKHDKDLGLAKDVQHRIDTGTSLPFKSQAIRRSKTSEAVAEAEIKKLLDAGLLVRSHSPWASPLLIVKKKDGSNRVVIDYRRLNSLTKKDSYPLPCIDDTIDKLGGAKYFSAMDLISGYWQIDLPAEEQEKCAIIAQSGLYQPTRMPQGLTNAPATFQQCMDSIMSDLKLSCVLVYLDDINVFSKTFSDHMSHLRAVFTRLCKAGLKLKPSKCQFFKNSLEFLGFVVTSKGVKPVPAKVEAIEKMKTPENLRDIQCFLGMLGYYRRFVPKFATLAEPLTYLL